MAKRKLTNKETRAKLAEIAAQFALLSVEMPIDTWRKVREEACEISFHFRLLSAMINEQECA